MKEIWKTIEEFPDYEISNMGRVKSNRLSTRKGVIMKPYTLGEYVGVKLWGGPTGKPKFNFVHRLVARSFVDGYEGGLNVNHKNFDKVDNRASNLEWITQRDNVWHYLESTADECTSHHIGVRRAGKNWTTSIVSNRKSYHLGTYKDPDEAVKYFKKGMEILKEEGTEALDRYSKELYFSRGTSMYSGVFIRKDRQKKWVAYVRHEGKQILRTRFWTEEEAVEAVINCRNEIGKPLHFSHLEYLKLKEQQK